MLTNALSQTNEEKFNNKETIFFLFAFDSIYYIQSISWFCEFIKSIFHFISDFCSCTKVNIILLFIKKNVSNS
jgi:hypothetical protein